MAVSSKNTKQEILDALSEAQKEIKELKAKKFDPVAETVEKENKAAVESAKETVNSNLFSEEITKKFTDLEKAIEVKSAELKELYGVEKELQNLVAIVNAGKSKKTELEATYEAKKAEMHRDIVDLQENYNSKNDALKKAYDESRNELEKQRKREAEEFQYNLKRSREKEDDVWADEKAKREAVVAEKEATAKALLAEVEAKAEEYENLKAEVEKIPALIEKARTEGLEAGKKEAGKEYGYKSSMAEKEHEFEVKVLNNKVDSLTAELTKVTSANESLQEKLDNAYAQIRELATKTVESTGGVKILSNGAADTRK